MKPKLTPSQILRKARKVSEHDVQIQILQWLRLKGYKALRVNSGGLHWSDKGGNSRYMKFSDGDGVSDILFWGRDCSGAIEVKEPGWKPPKMFSCNRKTGLNYSNPEWDRWKKQEEFLLDMMRHGQIGIFATSLEDVQAALPEDPLEPYRAKK